MKVRTYSILMLFLLVTSMLPWHLVCTTHPFGHDHHKQDDKPSTCDLHQKYAGVEGHHLLPPMECEHVSSELDKYQTRQKDEIKPKLQTLAVALVIFDLVELHDYNCNFIPTPEKRCNTDPPLSEISLRGPPLV